jgi:hypothetical protein
VSTPKFNNKKQFNPFKRAKKQYKLGSAKIPTPGLSFSTQKIPSGQSRNSGDFWPALSQVYIKLEFAERA